MTTVSVILLIMFSFDTVYSIFPTSCRCLPAMAAGESEKLPVARGQRRTSIVILAAAELQLTTNVTTAMEGGWVGGWSYRRGWW